MTNHRGMLLGLIAGAFGGLGVNAFAHDARWARLLTDYVALPLGQIFLRLLFMLVIPLLFSALVLGVCELDLKHLGRLGGRMLGYTVVVSAIAVTIGITLVNVIGPGRGVSTAGLALGSQMATLKAAAAPTDTSPVALIVNLFPDNVFKAAANGDMLAIIAFSLIFGGGLALTKTEGAERLKQVISGLFDVSMRLIHGVLRLAPLGVCALMFTATSRLGLDLLRLIALYVAVVLLGLGLHMFVVYSLSVRFFGGMRPLVFFRSIRLAMATAFSTASSNASLPAALEVAETNLKLPRHVSRFVLTAGSSMNQNGTALFEGVTVLFLAQVYGVELSFGQQVLVVVVCILAGIGTAGVPAGSLPVIAMILGMLKVPVEGIGLILGVDRFLDMCRTTLNVTGDLAAAVFVARGESEVEDQT
ncbi:MAG: dicarboxylate/amino acid:cation symporter [Polyangiaceae bacterium]|nr:dicarboxylate/amino acid:cation symporter [Polyangiaceae bacterium]MBK8997588.1 dicarboxylate/amino acid:cation symporter [Myxococcales bacterium]MCE7892133.1 dicarboxylate/amino acid:cation symporter [Sorangiineae bacterium PRO1]MCL4751248.1 dicarboxylate/amino acid:cation symporter [Myxococcales bacterium]